MTDRARPPEWLIRVEKAAERGVIHEDQIHTAKVQHDHWCADRKSWSGVCNCNPDIQVQLTTGEWINIGEQGEVVRRDN